MIIGFPDCYHGDMLLFIRLLVKSLSVIRYRLMQIELRDGSVVIAAVTKKTEKAIISAIYTGHEEKKSNSQKQGRETINNGTAEGDS